MKTARRQKEKLRFAQMPGDYVELCRLHLPRPIHDDAEYETTRTMAEVFAGFEGMMTEGQDDYFDLLCTLMEAWEKETVPAPKVTPLQLLKHILEQHEMSGADLSRILGATRRLGPMILCGKRSITADHARTLARRFGLTPGAFIE